MGIRDMSFVCIIGQSLYVKSASYSAVFIALVILTTW